jgi:putative ABC transport system permease protein
MSLLESLTIAVRSLCVNKLRSALTALGIIVGVAAVVCMISVGAGAQADVAEKIRMLGANLLVVMPGAQSPGGARLEAGTQATLTEEDASAIRRELNDVLVAAPLLAHSAHIVARGKNWATNVAGITTDYLIARDWRLSSGRPFTESELEIGDKVAIVGSVIVKELFDGAPSLGETIRIGNVPFTIIAVLENKGEGVGRSQDDVVFIPLSAGKSRVLGAVRGGTREALDFIAVKVSDPVAIPEVKGQLEALLRQRHRLRSDAASDFHIENPMDVLATRQRANRTLNYLLIAVASVSLIVGGISIMNIMLVSVTERTREIGLRMAVGARRRDIRRQFLIEAMTLAAAGGVIGALIGAAAAAIIAWKAAWPVLISPWALLLACGFAGGVGVFSGLYPAYRASQLDPIVALRFE